MTQILINLVPVGSGGGLQNALSLIDQLPLNREFFQASVVVCDNDVIYEACKRAGLGVCRINPSPLGRLWFEIFGGYLIAKENQTKIIFTLFGNAPIFSPGYYKISGFALSNILQPEVPFWDFLPLIPRFLKYVKDLFRLWAAKQSDEIILETYYLYKRAISGPLKHKVLHVVRMEPSSLVLQTLVPCKEIIKEDYFRFLVLSGPHPNKRIEKLAAIFARLEALRLNAGLQPPQLFLTLEKANLYSQKIFDAFCREKVQHCLSFIGAISQDKVGLLLSESDCMVNISRLESFSNNWVEAWAADIPLLTTDADWARASCGNAAIYINPDCPEKSADLVFRTLNSRSAVTHLIAAGRKQLVELRKTRKVDAYYRIIKSGLSRLSQ